MKARKREDWGQRRAFYDSIIHRVWVIGVILQVIFGAGVAGCAVEETQTPQEMQPPATSAPVNVEETTLPTSAIIVIPEDPPNFNPLVGDTGYDALVMELVMLGLTDMDPNGQIFAELAAELPLIENGGVLIDEEVGTMDVTWKLRQGIQWQDGKPVTADDLVFTYEAIANPETGGWMPGLDYIDSVEKIDDYTAVVHYASVYPGYLTQFGGEQVSLWPAHYCDATQGFIAWDCARQPLSNGPYLLEEWAVGDHLTFVRNPNYYQAGKPAIDQVIVRIVPDTSVRKTMLAKGDADVYMWVTEPIAKALESEPNVGVSISPNPRWVMRLFFNLAAKGSIDPVAEPHPILSDVRVRRAIQMAIDVDLISQEIFYGYGRPIWTEFFRDPYQCEIERPKYDPQAAMALLEEVGWKDSDGDGVRECRGCATAEEGYGMKMEMITYSEYGEALELTQQLIAEMLAEIGMQFQLTITEGSVMWADAASGGIEQNGNFDVDLYDDGYSGYDPTDFIWQYYHSASAEPDYGWNIGRWINPGFDALLESAYTLDEAARKELFCQMGTILADELPQVLLFSAINAEAYNIRISGIQATTNDLVTWNVADWQIVK